MAALSAPTFQEFCCAVICITELLLVCTTAMLFIQMILTQMPRLMWGSAFILFTFTICRCDLVQTLIHNAHISDQIVHTAATNGHA